MGLLGMWRVSENWFRCGVVMATFWNALVVLIMVMVLRRVLKRATRQALANFERAVLKLGSLLVLRLHSSKRRLEYYNRLAGRPYLDKRRLICRFREAGRLL